MLAHNGVKVMFHCLHSPNYNNSAVVMWPHGIHVATGSAESCTCCGLEFYCFSTQMICGQLVGKHVSDPCIR